MEGHTAALLSSVWVWGLLVWLVGQCARKRRAAAKTKAAPTTNTASTDSATDSSPPAPRPKNKGLPKLRNRRRRRYRGPIGPSADRYKDKAADANDQDSSDPQPLPLQHQLRQPHVQPRHQPPNKAVPHLNVRPEIKAGAQRHVEDPNYMTLMDLHNDELLPLDASPSPPPAQPYHRPTFNASPPDAYFVAQNNYAVPVAH